jgi:hypothetical protein
LGPETGARDSLAGAAIRLSRCDDPAPGGDERRNNDFEFGEDSDQRKCPYAAHIGLASLPAASGYQVIKAVPAPAHISISPSDDLSRRL